MTTTTSGPAIAGHATSVGYVIATDWPDIYNYTGSFLGEGSVIQAGYYYGGPGAVAGGISRAGGYFDTSVLPVGAYISQVKIKGQAKYASYDSYDQVHAYVRFCRLTILPANAQQTYAYVKDANVAYGQLYVPTNMTSYTAFEVTLNDYILGDIQKGVGAKTLMAFREIQDAPGTPVQSTQACAQLASIYLEITYDTVPGVLLIITLPATNITKTSAILNGEIAAGQASKRGFDWGIEEAMDNEWYESGTFGLGEFSHEITGLTQGTRYCFRAKGEESPA